MRKESVLLVVDQLAFLALLDRFDREAKLLFDLIVRDAVEVGHPRMNVEDRLHGTQKVFARVVDIVDVGLRQDALVAHRAGDLDAVCVLHLIDAIDAGFDRNPAQEVHQPTRRDARHLRNGLGRIG